MDESSLFLRILYDRHGIALLRYLQSLTGHVQLAEDLLQDTFVQAIKGLEQLRAARSPRAWLFSIARHLGLNAVSRRRATVPLQDNMAAASPQSADPRQERMREAIVALPQGQREALQLRLSQQLSYEEIAQVLEIPVGTVRSRIHHAVKSLRSALEQKED